MTEQRNVPLVRVERQERYFDREEVLGRDASSVFPTEAKKGAGLDPELVKSVLGGDRKFVSETELAEIKSKRGLSVEDGTIAADKPLAQILAEAREAKEVAFQEQWKQMKTGKNRPLDEDELEFIDSVVEAEAARLRTICEEEEAELAAFRAAAAGGGASAPAAALGPQLPEEETAPSGGAEQQRQRPPPPPPPKRKRPQPAVRPLIKPFVRPKQQQQRNEEEEPVEKRLRVGGAAASGAEGSGSEEEGPGLVGLLGGYGSDSGGSE